MDNDNTGVFSTLDETEKMQFMNLSLNIFENLMEKNIVENINLSMQDSIEQKISNYVYSSSSNDDSVYLIPSTISAMSSSANIKKQRQGQQSYELLEKTLNKVNKLKLVTLQPGGPVYNVSSSLISLKMFRQYGSDFNVSQTITNPVTKNKTGASSSTDNQTVETSVSLPSGLQQKVLNCMPSTKSSNTTFMVSTSMQSLKVNPYENIKTNFLVDVDSISGNSFNTAWINASVIKLVYRDLRRHTFDDLVNLYDQDTDLIQINFNGTILEKDGSSTEYDEPINIGSLENNNTVVFHHPLTSTEESRDDSIIIPCYKKLNYWTNAGCSLTTTTDSEIYTEKYNSWI